MRLVAVALLASGCVSYATSVQATKDAHPDVSRLHQVRIDRAASEVELIGAPSDNSAADSFLAKGREEMAQALEGALAGAAGPPEKARYQAVIKGGMVNLVPLIVPCVLVLTLMNCPAAHFSIDVELRLQIKDRVYAGKGSGGGGLFLLNHSAQDKNLSPPAPGRGRPAA